jgi:hypothetical protein
VVLKQDGTREENPYQTESGIPYDEASVDALFANTRSHVVLKKEKPEHRIMLWMRLQGHKPQEIATALRCTKQTVYNVQGQPWFKEAFVRLSTELGKDAAETFLRGEELPTYLKLVELRDGAESEAVQLSASNALLDRIRGKPVARVETKTESSVDITVKTIEELRKESEDITKKLRASGLLTGAGPGVAAPDAN